LLGHPAERRAQGHAILHRTHAAHEAAQLGDLIAAQLLQLAQLAGGGLGIAYTAADEPPSIDAYVDVKVRGVQAVFDPVPKVLVEPGRSLVGNAGLTRRHPLQRHLRDVLCSRVHTPQEDAVLLHAGRAVLLTPTQGA